ncbi:MAG TPA: glycosyl hydrolase family 28 protein [Verrucomicrobiae bacterium]|nr:glycosyl hydrolase family 28 protein [Verrucomicrobiae bacterium]
MRSFAAAIVFIGVVQLGWAWSAVPVDVRAAGAKGDGVAMDTAAIQGAIDRVAAGGGGEVRVPAGRYRIGSLQIRDAVRLHLEAGAILMGSADLKDYTLGRLIYAEGAKGIVIEGEGEIDGSGGAFWERGKPYAGPPWRGTAQFEYKALKRPRCLHFVRCEGLVLRGITIRNSPSWTVHLERCAGVTVEGLKIRNPLHGPNTDGIDVNSCRDVSIKGCDIVTGDDGVVLKSTEPGRDHPSRNITVEGCRIWSACNALKIGTETHSDFEGVTFRDCELYCGSTNHLERALSGVAIESVDGSNLRHIRVESIRMSNLRAPIFVRLGHRGGNSARTRQVEPRVPGTIRDVVIRNVRAEGMLFESSITGIPDHPVEGVALEDIRVTYEGGGPVAWVRAEVPDKEVIARYPEAQMFGRLPAYGLYVRHARDVVLDGVTFFLAAADARPAVVFDDVAGCRLTGLRCMAPTGGEPVLWFTGVRGAVVRDCVAPAGSALFLRVMGEATERGEVRMEGNDLSGAAKEMEFVTPGDLVAQLPLFSETAPGVILIEAERLALVPPMETVPESAAGGGAVIGVPAGYGRDVGKARGRFAVREAGRYIAKVRTFAPTPDGDSFYFSIDGGRERLSDVTTRGSWSWDSVRDRGDGAAVGHARVEFELSAGEHVLTLRNRESGLRIDALAIVRKDRLEEFERGRR